MQNLTVNTSASIGNLPDLANWYLAQPKVKLARLASSKYLLVPYWHKQAPNVVQFCFAASAGAFTLPLIQRRMVTLHGAGVAHIFTMWQQGCATCLNFCPFGAAEVLNNLVTLGSASCFNCGAAVLPRVYANT